MHSTIISTNIDTLNQAEQNISNLAKVVSSTINYYDNNKRIFPYLISSFEDDYEQLKNIQVLESNLQNYLSTINLTNIDIILVGENNIIYSTSSNPPKISTTSLKKKLIGMRKL